MAVDSIDRASRDELEALRRRVAELEGQLAERAEPAGLAAHQLAAVEKAMDGIAVLDSQGRYVYMNRAHAQVHGYDDPAELIGKSWEVIVPERLLPMMREQAMPMLYRDGSWSGTMLSKRRDGSEHPTDSSLSVLDDGGLLCIVRDMSQSQAAEEELQRSRLMLQMVIDSMPQAIYWKDRELRYLGCNRRFAEQAQLPSPAAIVGKSDMEMVWGADAETYRAEDRLVLHEGRTRIGEAQHGEGPDSVWVRMTKIPLHDAEGQVFAILGMFEDVSAQKRQEMERARLQEEIIQAQAAALAELSTPLIPINDQVMVMPLVGSMDSRRAQQVLDTLLTGIADSHASSVILDITGVPVVDTQVANALLRAAQSVKLLGAQVILTGIRPEVAQTLVSLGTDLSSITTRSSLQSGITFATGMRVG